MRCTNENQEVFYNSGKNGSEGDISPCARIISRLSQILSVICMIAYANDLYEVELNVSGRAKQVRRVWLICGYRRPSGAEGVRTCKRAARYRKIPRSLRISKKNENHVLNPHLRSDTFGRRRPPSMKKNRC